MIYDKLENMTLYSHIYPNLERAAEFILSGKLAGLEKGRHVIDGDDVYVNIMESSLIDASEGSYEVHRQYIDIHIDLSGQEKVLLCPLLEEKITSAYDEGGDYALLSGDSTIECALDGTDFVMCMPGEPHKPCVRAAGGQDAVRKAVVKVRI